LWGRVREGGTFAGGVNNDLQNTLSIPQHVRIPESNDAVAFSFKPAIAFNVLLGICVLTAIDFNHKLLLVAHKIEDERSEGNLTPKAQPI
jgi:hypothetical protein